MHLLRITVRFALNDGNNRPQVVIVNLLQGVLHGTNFRAVLFDNLFVVLQVGPGLPQSIDELLKSRIDIWLF